MPRYPIKGGGITKLSELTIDADKDWQAMGISNIKEVVAGMDVGAVILKGLGGVLVKLAPGVANKVLTSHGPGLLPDWQPGGTYYNRYYPAEFFLTPAAVPVTPDEMAAVIAQLTRTLAYTNDAPTLSPNIDLPLTATMVVPDGSAAIVSAMATVKTLTSRYYPLASGDDCYRFWTGAVWSFSIVSLYHRVGYQAAGEYKAGGGFRFLIADIPNAAVIDSAYLYVRARSDKLLAVVNSGIDVQDSDDAAVFLDDADYIARPRVAGGATPWNGIASWTTGVWYTSPDFTAKIQAVVNRVGWAAGQHMVVFWHDEADLSTHTAGTIRETSCYDEDKFKAVRLYIAWH